MINKITKKVVKEVTETISEEFVCDICGKKGNYEKYRIDNDYVRFFTIKTGHYDWGNESVDSIERLDACSVECLLEAFNKWLNDKDNQRSDTAYIHIDKDIHLKERKNDIS